MTGPIETAYQAFAAAMAEGLVAAEFLAAAAELAVDPAAAIEAAGDDLNWSAAAILNLGTAPVRTLMGAGRARYIVERQVRVELAALSADKAWVDEQLQAAQTAAANVAVLDFTLGGRAERLALTSAEVDDIPPSGRKVFLAFVIRVSSGDPLGMTA